MKPTTPIRAPKDKLSVLALATLLAAISTTTMAQPVCTNANALHTHLTTTAGETLIFEGPDGNGTPIRLYTSPRGSWSITLDGPISTACIVASGSSFTMAPLATLRRVHQ